MPSVIAVDVGGTSIKAACSDETGRVLDRRSVRTPVADGAQAIVAAIGSVARELLRDDVRALGVVVPGAVDAANGLAGYAANLAWRDVPLRGQLEIELGLPVVIENDVRAAGLAERTLGRARDVPDCLIVVIGTGIAGVVVAGGAPIVGAAGLAGELGHVSVRADGEVCACGQRGCAERYASGAAIARRYAERSGSSRTAEEIADRLACDPHAAQVWAEAADALGALLAAVTQIVDPSLIVLAGGLARAGGTLRAPVQRALEQHLVWRAPPEVGVSPLAGEAGVLGAALLAWQAAAPTPR